MQGGSKGGKDKSEDCLYLNVFSPAVRSELLPVMVWIHGGGLTGGSGASSPPERLTRVSQAVIVTINYRLGFWGFYTTGDDVVEGNVGFIDQVLALRWVKNNIVNFGGDPDKITIFGESAGAWSVGLHLISPLSEGLFRRAIGQSGALNGLDMDTREEKYASQVNQIFLAILNCASNDTREVLTCLQGKTADQLSEAGEWSFIDSAKVPTVGGSFLPQDPAIMYENLERNPEVIYDVIYGFNSDEALNTLGKGSIEENRTVSDYYEQGMYTTDRFYTNGLPKLIENLDRDPEIAREMFNLVEDHYITNKSDPLQVMRATLDMNAELGYLLPTIKTLNDLDNAGHNVYLYYLDRVPEPNENFPKELLFLLYPYGTETPAFRIGAYHTLDIYYIFGDMSEEGGMYHGWMEEGDVTMGRSMMRAWSTFAATGVPEYLTEDGAAVVWPKYDQQNRTYLDFATPLTEYSAKGPFKSATSSFHLRLLPAFAKAARCEQP